MSNALNYLSIKDMELLSSLYSFILFYCISFKLSLSYAKVLHLNQTQFENLLEQNLYIGKIIYNGNCDFNSRVLEFEESVKSFEEIGLPAVLNLTFVKLSQTEDFKKTNKAQNCTALPSIYLHKYGSDGKVLEFNDEFNKDAILKWFQTHLEPPVHIFQTNEQLNDFVLSNEFTVIAYFKSFESRLQFWKAADENLDYNWAEVINPDLNPYDDDAIVLNQEFGVSRLRIEENITSDNIEDFVKRNGKPFNTVLELTDTNFQNIVETTLLVFVVFYDASCPAPVEFEEAARRTKENGIQTNLEMKFGKVNIEREVNLRSEFGLSVGCTQANGYGSSWEKIRLFKYGRIKHYGANVIGKIIWSKESFTINGLFSWLEKYAKPPLYIIRNFEDLHYYLSTNQVTVLGYFKDGSKSKLYYWNLADTTKLKQYNWAAVVNPLMNPFPVDTVIINQKFGAVQLYLNNSLTKENIEQFVKNNANSSDEKASYNTTTVTTTTSISTHSNIPHTNTQKEVTTPVFKDIASEENIVLAYSQPKYNGNVNRVELSSGCFNVNWPGGILSMRTFGHCVVLYESLNCKADVNHQTVLNGTNPHVGQDLSVVDFGLDLRLLSFKACENISENSTDSASTTNTKVLIITPVIFTVFSVVINYV